MYMNNQKLKKIVKYIQKNTFLWTNRPLGLNTNF